MKYWVYITIAFSIVGFNTLPSQASPAPTSLDISAPRKLAKVIVPKDVPRTPPPDSWWTQDSACPDGASYLLVEEYGRQKHECKDDKGLLHGPTTTVGRKGKVEGDAWYRHGKKHGLERIRNGHTAEQSYTYVNGQRHGPADEYGDIGSYYRGERHGRWKLIRSGQSPQHGYYLRGMREGVWLSGGLVYGVPQILAKARYRKDKLSGPVIWWTERGGSLAIGRSSMGRTTWKFGAGKKVELTVVCKGKAAQTIQFVREKKKLQCSYGKEGELVRQEGVQGGIGCPGEGVYGLCSAHILDPYSGARSISEMYY